MSAGTDGYKCVFSHVPFIIVTAYRITVARICHCPHNSLHSPLVPLHSPLISLHCPLKHRRVLGESGVTVSQSPLSPELVGVSGESGVGLGESGVSSGGSGRYGPSDAFFHLCTPSCQSLHSLALSTVLVTALITHEIHFSVIGPRPLLDWIPY